MSRPRTLSVVDLVADVEGANATLTIDLDAQEIRGPDGGVIHFDIDPFRKKCLLEGLDDIGMTLAKQDSIADYEAKARMARPWT